jgi:hypothetical protein
LEVVKKESQAEDVKNRGNREARDVQTKRRHGQRGLKREIKTEEKTEERGEKERRRERKRGGDRRHGPWVGEVVEDSTEGRGRIGKRIQNSDSSCNNRRCDGNCTIFLCAFLSLFLEQATV